MAGPPVAVAAVRVAVRRALDRHVGGGLVLVACSGGPDSVALAAATAFEAPRRGLRAGLLTVDHGLQDGSAERAAAVAGWAGTLGLDPAEALTVAVGSDGGPEAAARTARYAALGEAADRLGAGAVLLGHTEDDQAETVLLALARGSGARALAGMAERRGRYLRPLLCLPRSVVRSAAGGLPTWDDPHNADHRFARSRVRALLPALEQAAGRGTVAGLARSARLARADADLLDELAAAALARVTVGDGELDAAALAAEPPALRTRALHAWALALGVPGGSLASAHVDALDALVTAWHGQGAAHLPSGIAVGRSDGRLRREGQSARQ